MRSIDSIKIVNPYLSILYNSLPYVGNGDKGLHRQFDSSGIPLAKLLAELAPLFSDGEKAGKFWLLHRHFPLYLGERMVGRGDTMEPTTNNSSRIVAKRWNRQRWNWSTATLNVTVWTIPRHLPPNSGRDSGRLWKRSEADPCPWGLLRSQTYGGLYFYGVDQPWRQEARYKSRSVGRSLLEGRNRFQAAWIPSSYSASRCSHGFRPGQNHTETANGSMAPTPDVTGNSAIRFIATHVINSIPYRLSEAFNSSVSLFSSSNVTMGFGSEAALVIDERLEFNANVTPT
ncbi:hypothetical protein M422DRAFT_50228 [Sphaerobolus stellatus SS14]|uniref:Uncharacterized protein n=1 Tax=Sphaerobolus stellatus (strain SS14) TaxID=990650 RepID=A0A0C9U4Q9_SPHS4|nr:hypothetical protein M422DRAFT_50228 [Sphaerobolus stellatus SS14]